LIEPNRSGFNTASADEAIQEFVDLISEKSMRDLLASFFDGNPKLVFAPLLYLMDTGKDGKISFKNFVQTHCHHDNKPIKQNSLCNV
jgi:Ca2+-binding EF-hand superfamily protein